MDEIEKFFQMVVIELVVFTEEQEATESIMDTTLVYDWR